jgi:hypothetical protein
MSRPFTGKIKALVPPNGTASEPRVIAWQVGVSTLNSTCGRIVVALSFSPVGSRNKALPAINALLDGEAATAAAK